MSKDLTTVQMITLGTNGRTRTKAIGNANPNAKKSELRTFAESMAELSTRTLTGVYKVDKKNISDATQESSQADEPAITPAVTIADGALKITSPLLTASKGNSFPMKILCTVINEMGLNVTYTNITGFIDSPDENHCIVTGTLDNGVVLTASNIYANTKLNIITNKLLDWDKSANKFIDSSSAELNTECGTSGASLEDLSTAISSGVFSSMSNFITHFNAKWANAATNGYGMQLSYDAANAILSFTPTFASAEASKDVFVLGSGGGFTIWDGLTIAIGESLFNDYYSRYTYTFEIPNPAAV